MTITQQKLDYIRLARSQNIGSINFFKFLEVCKTPAQALKEIIESQHKNFNQNIKLASAKDVEQEVECVSKFGAQIITFFDEGYPQFLKEIADPPPLITVKGRLDLLRNQHIIAIVGARNASLNGINFAKKIAFELGQYGFIITSGLARGIDCAAHQASLSCGTIAVIAGGIDNIYPAENKNLYHQIYEKGVVISEQPFGVAPLAKNFIRRNRIISGLAVGTLVIEAGLKSGSLTTANFANDQGRQVFAVPGAPYDHRSMGCNKLIKDGAKIVETSNDILEEFSLIKECDYEFKAEEKSSLNNSSFNNSKDNIKDENLSKIHDQILNILDFSGVDIDSIIEKTGIKANILKANLLELELMQKIYSKNGIIFLKK